MPTHTPARARLWSATKAVRPLTGDGKAVRPAVPRERRRAGAPAGAGAQAPQALGARRLLRGPGLSQAGGDRGAPRPGGECRNASPPAHRPEAARQALQGGRRFAHLHSKGGRQIRLVHHQAACGAEGRRAGGSGSVGNARGRGGAGRGGKGGDQTAAAGPAARRDPPGSPGDSPGW